MIIDVAVPYRVARSFHYLIDDEVGKDLKLGSLVEVSFRKRTTHAFVLGFPASTTLDPAKLKNVEKVLVADPLFDQKMLTFLTWVASYYCHPLGEVIATALPRPSLVSIIPKKRKKPIEEKEILGLQSFATAPPVLTAEQTAAVAQILDPAEKRPVLLHGVTGSGKTEVYMSVLEKVIADGKDAIILVPEIALTPQLLGRFSARFPEQVAVLHSELTPSERASQWRRLREGRARVVIGPRSAVFAPLKNLGLIVVDEEQEGSFKQEDSVRYHARDVAIMRAHLEGAKVVLGSATPSMESYAHSQSGKYLYVRLTQRVHQKPLPATTFVDLKEKENLVSPAHPWLSMTLLNKVRKTLAAGHQSLIYLNRLGFAHFLFCEDCGHTWRCRNCDVALTYYRNPPSLQCHYCGAHRRPPDSCEECNGSRLTSLGVGTEQVEKSLHELLPEARIARMDRSVIKGRKDLESLLTQISERAVDIVIGTQMIAKGHDFPGIALVGILLADSSLNLPDFRAHERTYQIITQVSGRAGRADITGEVVIQTVNPQHPVLLAAAENRMADFYRNELDARKQFGFPPYQRLAMIRFQYTNPSRVQMAAEEVVRALRGFIRAKGLAIHVLGPAEAPLARVNRQYRWHCLVKADSVKSLQLALQHVNEFAAASKSPVQVAVDVDPMNAL